MRILADVPDPGAILGVVRTAEEQKREKFLAGERCC